MMHRLFSFNPIFFFIQLYMTKDHDGPLLTHYYRFKIHVLHWLYYC